jgi:hypothetical protein
MGSTMGSPTAGVGLGVTVRQFDTGTGHVFGHGYAVLALAQARQMLALHRRVNLIDDLFSSEMEEA